MEKRYRPQSALTIFIAVLNNDPEKYFLTRTNMIMNIRWAKQSREQLNLHQASVSQSAQTERKISQSIGQKLLYAFVSPTKQAVVSKRSCVSKSVPLPEVSQKVVACGHDSL